MKQKECFLCSADAIGYSVAAHLNNSQKTNMIYFCPKQECKHIIHELCIGVMYSMRYKGTDQEYLLESMAERYRAACTEDIAKKGVFPPPDELF